ncbi:MAG: undecaprenyl-diphosphate phosphatase [Defluviitaleaceae bacterium]|nr:undecaprenyl-diphosphate phosphatase [Defluviitaleaceae bacterium]
MTIIEALILGIIQGIAEFLPISSSGHLLLVQRIFGIEDNLLTFTIIVHIGTLIPVLIIYFNRVSGLIKKPFQLLTLLLIIGTLPLVLLALFAGDFVDMIFTGDFIAFGFLITAIVLLITDKIFEGTKDIKDLTKKDALLVGLFQAVAIIPGISRSGSTILGGVLTGANKKTAANFSFLLSIPAIMGGMTLEIIRLIREDIPDIGFFFTAPVLIGFFTSMIAGFFAIKIMLALVVKNKMKYFAYYLLVLSLFIFVDKIFIGRFF